MYWTLQYIRYFNFFDYLNVYLIITNLIEKSNLVNVNHFLTKIKFIVYINFD